MRLPAKKPNFPSPPAPLPKERGVFKQFLNSCESSCRGGTLNDDNVLTKYTALFTRIWLIFGAIQRRRVLKLVDGILRKLNYGN